MIEQLSLSTTKHIYLFWNKYLKQQDKYILVCLLQIQLKWLLFESWIPDYGVKLKSIVIKSELSSLTRDTDRLIQPILKTVNTEHGRRCIFSVLKQCPVVPVPGDRSKVQCCKEQDCIGTLGNVRAMNRCKLEVVEQEMARVNINLLGISELKWTGMDEFNSDDHYIYYCGQESIRRNGVTLTVNKSLKCNT